jgi:hypothetical protein
VRRLIASEFVTLDGAMEVPGHEPHPDGKNAWVLRHAGEDQQRYKIDEVFAAGAILLGPYLRDLRHVLADGSQGEGFGDRMNDIPKYVVSRSLKTTAWQNSIILSGDDRALRQRRPPELPHQARPRRRVPDHGVPRGAGQRQTPVPRCGGIWGVPSASRERPHNNE